jgi:hypothetical protein
MLNRDRIKGFGLCLLMILIINSCKDKSNDKDDKLYKQYSLYITSEVTYNEVYKQANDTVHNWIDNNLTIAKAYNVSNWKIDSLLCFNKKADRCVLCIYRQYNDEVNNAIDFLYGVKISNKWYFFEGAVIYIFSEKYGYNPKTPLPFAKLHEIAIEEIFNGYLIKKKKNTGRWKNIFAPEYEYKINERWFDYHFKGSGWGCGYMGEKGWIDTCSEEEFEQLYYKKALSNWERK